jgi:hypothetical protein
MMPGCLCAPPSRLHPFCRMVSWCTCLGEEQVGNVTKQEGRRIVFASASFFISLYFGPPQCLRLATAFGASGQGHGMSYPYAVQLFDLHHCRHVQALQVRGTAQHSSGLRG